MDFGVTSFDTMAYSSIRNGSFGSANGTESKKLKWCGSGFVKQERTLNEDVFREFKLNETCNGGNFFEGQQQMLSFCSPNSQAVAVAWPYLQNISGPFSKNTGQCVRGSFLTPSQWIELEHQALIYKYITANVPVPSCLLNPIRKALESAGFSSFHGRAFGWGGFHLGYSSTDPEPGRCRRTDGKKWRCARDAVADQKYCERHMNRGRHRSRKPVEGQNGHSAATITAVSDKLAPNNSSKPAPAAPSGRASNTLSLSRSRQVSLELGIPNTNANRCVPEKDNTEGVNRHATILSMTTSGTSLEENQYDKSYTRSEFGLVSSDSLVNPLDRNSPIVNCGSHNTSDDIDDQESKSKNPLQQFINNWPKSRSDQRSTFSWPDHLDLQPDGTQLSISIPVVTSDFMSPSKNELQANQMGLGLGKISPHAEENRIRTNWIPISWEGGPLGEALNTTNNSYLEPKNAKALDIQDNSPRSAFGSLSNSS